MNENIIRDISREIINETIIGNYQTYLIMFLLVILTITLHSFLSSYFKTRGERFATKSDFDEIIHQLKETTNISEEIKSDINKKSIEELNLKVLIREKLELLITESFILELWLEKSRDKAMNRILPDLNDSPIFKMEMYQAIYFKEIIGEMLIVQSNYYPMINFILKIIDNTSVVNSDDFESVHKELSNSLVIFRKNAIEKYAQKYEL